MKKVLSLIACIGLSLALNAQNKKVFGTKDGELIHESSESYEWPTDAKVLEKLDKWQDVKFGIMYHWGIYSVPGITESSFSSATVLSIKEAGDQSCLQPQTSTTKFFRI